MMHQMLALVATLAVSCGAVSWAQAPLTHVAVGVDLENGLSLADFSLTGRAVQGGILRGRAPDGVQSLRFDDADVFLSEDRQFLLAFDRDAPAQQLLHVTMMDGSALALRIAVTAGAWRIEHINAPIRGAASSNEDFQRRRAAELVQIAEARSVGVQSEGWRQRFIWPVEGRKSGSFGAQRIYQGVPASYHSGADIAAPRGTPFVAPADGVVVLAAQVPFTLEGYLLIISHGAGLNSAFLHCDRLDVRIGDDVRQGQVLGTVGATGRATGAHMHWSVKWGTGRVNPASLTE